MSDHDFSGEIRYSSAYEHEVADDPYCALDYSETGDPTDVALPARILASHWHGGQSSALYAFASSGYLDVDDCLAELGDAIQPDAVYPDTDASALAAFFRSLQTDTTTQEGI